MLVQEEPMEITNSRKTFKFGREGRREKCGGTRIS